MNTKQALEMKTYNAKKFFLGAYFGRGRGFTFSGEGNMIGIIGLLLF